MLFTHRGISGPAILQISSYWEPGEILDINLLPDHALLDLLKAAQKLKTDKLIKTFLSDYLPKRVIEVFIPEVLLQKKMLSCSHREFEEITESLQHWQLKPNGTEGYRTAEVTLGGIDCDALSSKTMEVIKVPNLYFIGEAVDVQGWLGGFNFQWAWSSGWAAGQVV
jgi:predicted Rossmann fold flavoprotein